MKAASPRMVKTAICKVELRPLTAYRLVLEETSPRLTEGSALLRHCKGCSRIKIGLRRSSSLFSGFLAATWNKRLGWHAKLCKLLPHAVPHGGGTYLRLCETLFPRSQAASALLQMGYRRRSPGSERSLCAPRAIRPRKDIEASDCLHGTRSLFWLRI